MTLNVRQVHGAIDTSISCRIEWCNSQGVWFSFVADVDGNPRDALESLGFRVRESITCPGVFCCPWESADGGDCYIAVMQDR